MTRATDSTPITESFLPPTEFYAYLDQFLTNSTLGATLFRSELVWVSEADVAQGLTASRMRAAYKATDAADEQAKSMRSTLTLTRTPNPNPNPNPIPNPNPTPNPNPISTLSLSLPLTLTQVKSMRDLRSAVNTAGVGGAFPYMFMFLYYEQVR